MLKKLIQDILENSDYQISNVNKLGEVLHIILNEGRLKVSVNPTSTFNVNGDKQKEEKILEDYIKKNLRQPIKEIALTKLNKDVKAWNVWRRQFNQFRIDLSQLAFIDNDFSGINFHNVDLSYTELRNVKLVDANLRESIMHGTKFIKCNLKRAKLNFVEANLAVFNNSNLDYSELYSGNFEGVNFQNSALKGVELDEVILRYADLSNTDFRETDLSGAFVNTETNFHKAVGIEKGINGYWNAETDSAALFSESPPGNSMKGPNIDAVLESLKRARKYFGFSFLLSLGAILLWYLKQESTSIPLFNDFVLTTGQYLNIGMVSSLGLLILSKLFLDDSFEGMKYLEERKSAMAVGSFPWALTKFVGKKPDQIIISLISRLVLCLHPLAYLFLFDYSQVNFLLIGLLIILTTIGIWILFFTDKFQQPILFDQKTEEEKRNHTIVDKLDQLVKSLNIRELRSRIKNR